MILFYYCIVFPRRENIPKLSTFVNYCQVVLQNRFTPLSIRLVDTGESPSCASPENIPLIQRREAAEFGVPPSFALAKDFDIGRGRSFFSSSLRRCIGRRYKNAMSLSRKRRTRMSGLQYANLQQAVIASEATGNRTRRVSNLTLRTKKTPDKNVRPTKR
jgi:hypothetical protein